MADIHNSDTPRNRGDTDAPHMSPVTPAEDARTIIPNKVSSGAVLAGVVVAVVTQLILNLLGIGFGAATLDPGTGAGQNPSVSTFSIGAGIWFALAGILASLAGGGCSSLGRVARCIVRSARLDPRRPRGLVWWAHGRRRADDHGSYGLRPREYEHHPNYRTAGEDRPSNRQPHSTLLTVQTPGDRP
jgi:hypothetical protein